jgi:hypothetical protein
MWAPCLEEELASCVVLVFVFHNVKVPMVDGIAEG